MAPEVVVGSLITVIGMLGGFAVFVLKQAKDQVAPVKALADTTHQSLLAHQVEDRENYLDLKADLKEIKDILRGVDDDAEGSLQ